MNADVPSSMRANIAVEGRGLHLYPESANDVVCAVKRYASDSDLSQEWGSSPSEAVSVQELVLVFPAAFLAMLGSVPTVPRALKQFEAHRRKKLLALAELLIDTDPTESSKRTARYLLSICDSSLEPEPLPPIHWVSTQSPGEFDGLARLDLGGATAGRLMPQMKFVARIAAPRRTR